MATDQKHDPGSARKSKANPSTFLDRDNWIRAVLASDLPDSAVRVAIAIALHLRVKTGQCNPSFPTLARESHLVERSIYRLVALLEHAGWIEVHRTRGGRLSNFYRLITPDRTESPLTQQSPLTQTASTPDSRRQPPLTQTPFTPDSGSQGKRRKSEERRKAGEKRVGAARPPRAPAPDDASLRGSSDASIEDGFERFWAIYPRKENKDDARAAFVRAVAAGVAIDAMISGVAIYAAVRAAQISGGDAPKWTLYPATWIKKRKWTDPPPDGLVIDEAGNVVGVEQPQAGEELSLAEHLRQEGLGNWYDENGKPIIGKQGAGKWH
jgi:Helix-turn-helix domain